MSLRSNLIPWSVNLRSLMMSTTTSTQTTHLTKLRSTLWKEKSTKSTTSTKTLNKDSISWEEPHNQSIKKSVNMKKRSKDLNKRNHQCKRILSKPKTSLDKKTKELRKSEKKLLSLRPRFPTFQLKRTSSSKLTLNLKRRFQLPRKLMKLLMPNTQSTRDKSFQSLLKSKDIKSKLQSLKWSNWTNALKTLKAPLLRSRKALISFITTAGMLQILKSIMMTIPSHAITLAETNGSATWTNATPALLTKSETKSLNLSETKSSRSPPSTFSLMLGRTVTDLASKRTLKAELRTTRVTSHLDLTMTSHAQVSMAMLKPRAVSSKTSHPPTSMSEVMMVETTLSDWVHAQSSKAKARISFQERVTISSGRVQTRADTTTSTHAPATDILLNTLFLFNVFRIN